MVGIYLEKGNYYRSKLKEKLDKDLGWDDEAEEEGGNYDEWEYQ